MGTKIIEELSDTILILPTEVSNICVCEATTRDPNFEMLWYCTREDNHNGPHIATYTSWNNEQDCKIIVIGLVWTDVEK